LIVLQEARYAPEEDSVTKPQFEKTYRPFLRDLAAHLDAAVRPQLPGLPAEMAAFWDRVVQRCQA